MNWPIRTLDAVSKRLRRRGPFLLIPIRFRGPLRRIAAEPPEQRRVGASATLKGKRADRTGGLP